MTRLYGSCGESNTYRRFLTDINRHSRRSIRRYGHQNRSRIRRLNRDRLIPPKNGLLSEQPDILCMNLDCNITGSNRNSLSRRLSKSKRFSNIHKEKTNAL